MISQQIALRRLFSQQIAGGAFSSAEELVQWMGCIRAEDLAGAKWAIGARVAGGTDDSIGSAFNQGRILRMHVLQPVRQLISPADVHWMLALTASRVKAINKGLFRSLEIDGKLLLKSKQVMIRALEAGELTRAQLLEALARSKLPINEVRLGLILMDAELDGLICNGSGVTYALLEERVPIRRFKYRDESIAELTKRYFFSRGPATVNDLAAWSGLRAADIQIGMEINKSLLASEVIDGQTYWFDPSFIMPEHSRSLFLLPALDELGVAYAGNSFFKPMLVIDGQVSGSWTAAIRKGAVTIEVSMPEKRDSALQTAIAREAERYSRFLGRRLILPTG